MNVYCSIVVHVLKVEISNSITARKYTCNTNVLRHVCYLGYWVCLCRANDTSAYVLFWENGMHVAKTSHSDTGDSRISIV